MARAVDFNERLVRLREARLLFKPADVCNLEELAKAAGVTSRRMSAEIKDDKKFPVKDRGRQGVDYTFAARKTLDYMIAKCEAAASARSARSERLAQMTGLDIQSGSSGNKSGYSLIELSKAVDLTLKLDEGRRAQGQQCSTDRSSSLFARLVDVTLNGIMGVTHDIDPTNMLPPEVKTAMTSELRALAGRIKMECEKEATKFRANNDSGANRACNRADRIRRISDRSC